MVVVPLLVPLLVALAETGLPRRLQRLITLAEQEGRRRLLRLRWQWDRHRKQDFRHRDWEEPHLSATANHLTGTFACHA